jgi:hypothetical protein
VYDQYKEWAINEGCRSLLKKGKFCDVLMEKFPHLRKRRLGPAGKDRPFYLEGIAFISSTLEEQSNDGKMITECFAPLNNN